MNLKNRVRTLENIITPQDAFRIIYIPDGMDRLAGREQYRLPRRARDPGRDRPSFVTWALHGTSAQVSRPATAKNTHRRRRISAAPPPSLSYRLATLDA
jgi:hypothetical protein